MPGIAIQHAGGGHGIAALDINSGLSVMRLHYHNDNDTAFYDFLISPLSARVNVLRHHFTQGLADFNDPQHHRIGWRREVARVGRVGVQNAGLVPHLTSLVDSAGQSPTILKAELTVPVESERGHRLPATPKTSCLCFGA